MDNGVDHPEENSELKQLLALGRARGYLTYGEINDHLPQDIVEAEQLESIVAMLTEMGIRVSDAPPDMEELLMSGDSVTEDEAVEEAAAAMTAVEREGRTTDPVRMYMREMGTVELLTREGEIAIAKRIEAGQQQVVAALLQLPRALDEVFGLYDQVQAGQLRLPSFVAGFYESDEPEAPPAAEVVEEATAGRRRRRRRGGRSRAGQRHPGGGRGSRDRPRPGAGAGAFRAAARLARTDCQARVGQKAQRRANRRPARRAAGPDCSSCASFRSRSKTWPACCAA